jgi:H+/Cl- antiporter ClcA
MEAAKIVLLCIAAAVVYGILHDQVTARVCVEYFTIGHPPVFHTESPTLLGLGWGIVATWWVGVILGIPAALVSRVGSWPKIDAARLIRPIGRLLIVMACAALVAGIVGYVLARTGRAWLVEPLKSQVPAERHAGFIADLCAHLASYGVGFVGGIIICGRILLQRRRMARAVVGVVPAST